MILMHDDIKLATDKAQEAFWAAVAAHFPEIKTGDFPPLDQTVFDLSCEKAIRTWVEINSRD